MALRRLIGNLCDNRGFTRRQRDNMPVWINLNQGWIPGGPGNGFVRRIIGPDPYGEAGLLPFHDFDSSRNDGQIADRNIRLFLACQEQKGNQGKRHKTVMMVTHTRGD